MNPLFYKKKCCCAEPGGPDYGPPCANLGNPSYSFVGTSGAVCNTRQKFTWSPVVSFNGPQVYGRDPNLENCLLPDDDGYEDMSDGLICGYTRVIEKQDVQGSGCSYVYSYPTSGAWGYSVDVWRGTGVFCGESCQDPLGNSCADRAFIYYEAEAGANHPTLPQGVSWGISADIGVCLTSKTESYYSPGTEWLTFNCNVNSGSPSSLLSSSARQYPNSKSNCPSGGSADECAVIKPDHFYAFVSGYVPIQAEITCNYSGQDANGEPCVEFDGERWTYAAWVAVLEADPPSSWPSASTSGGGNFQYSQIAGWVQDYGKCTRTCRQIYGFDCQCDLDSTEPDNWSADACSISSLTVPMSCADWTQVPCA